MYDSRAAMEALDRADELREFRARFELPAGVVYLDGNSLGPLPRQTRERLARVVAEEWGEGLIRSWNQADWISLPQRVGGKIARLVGAEEGEVIAADSTSVNLYKLLSVALQANPSRRLILTERTNFPTDLYVTHGLLEQLNRDDPGTRYAILFAEGNEDAVEQALAERGADVAVVLLTQVNYCTGRLYDMQRVTAAAQRAGALTIWDLSHTAGALTIDLAACNVDFAIGCGYKYLNGGPGAPAYLFVALRHQERFTQPLSGWMGHAQPFAFRSDYEAAPGIARYLCGTPSVIAMAALESSLDVMLEAPMEAIRKKSLALTDAFMALVARECADLGLNLITPRAPSLRGSQVSYTHPASQPVMQALIARGIIGDCRAPDVLRFGFAPLYVRYVDVWDAVAGLKDILAGRIWGRAEFQARGQVI